MSKRLRADDRKRQILHAAVRCFARYGYRGATTAALAREAGCSEPILYRHFQNKQGLFLALLDLAANEAQVAFQTVIGPIKSPIEQLRAMLRLNPATADPRMTELYRVIFHAQSEHTDERVQAALSAHYRRYADFLTIIIAQAQKAGQVRADLSAEGLAWQLIHSAVGYAMIKPLDIPGHITRQAVEQTMALLMEQIVDAPAANDGKAKATPRRGATTSTASVVPKK